MDAVPGFYDQLAPYYHLIFHNWDESIARQGAASNALLEKEMGAGPLKILDCSCGIGTQAIGFARHGHRMVCSDLSAAAVERAKREFETRGLDGSFVVSDMKSLAEIEESDFDVVVSLDNALPHLSPNELCAAARAMFAKLRPGGLLLASIRNYDALIRERPMVEGPTFFGPAELRRIVLQVWDWVDTERYILHLFITVNQDGRWDTHHFVSTYRCLQRDELKEALVSAGFLDPRWIMPGEIAHYIPFVVAHKPARG